MNFFRFFGVNKRFKKIFEVFDRVSRSLEIWSQCAPTKNLRNYRQGDAVTGNDVPMTSTPYQNFKYFFKALIHSKKSEKIHGYSW